MSSTPDPKGGRGSAEPAEGAGEVWDLTKRGFVLSCAVAAAVGGLLAGAGCVIGWVLRGVIR